VELRKEECELLGYDEHPYDALLDEYEPNLKTSDIDLIFDDVKINLCHSSKKYLKIIM
jgi:carboxypeptidase Taq